MKMLTLVVCMLVVSVMKAEDVKDTKVYVPELSSMIRESCYNKTGEKCPKSAIELELRMASCDYNCSSELSYECKEDTNGRGILEFCAKPEECDKGWMNKVCFDDNHHQIIIEKSVCPDGFYQPVRGNCYTACTYFKHEDADHIEHLGIKVLYPGNNTDPGRGYCDTERGFVSSNSNMYTSLAENEVTFCKLVDFETYCPADKRLLPDRNCGDICEKGFVVDIWNNFKCSKYSGDESTTVILPTTAHPYIDVTPSPTGISTKQKHITTQVMQSTSPSHTEKHLSIGSALCVLIIAVISIIIEKHLLCIKLIIIGSALCVLIIAVISCIIVWFVRKKKKKPKIVENNIETNSGCSYSKIEANTVNIGNFYFDGKKEADRDRSRRTNDTTSRSENLSDMEQDCTSLGSGYS